MPALMDYSHSPLKFSLHISHNITPVNAMDYACNFYACSQLWSIHVCMNTVCMNGFRVDSRAPR